MKQILIAIVLILSLSAMAHAVDIVNEKTTWRLSLAWYDEDNAAAIPTSVSYRIDDADTGVSVLSEQTFTPSAATHSLVITAAQNAIVITGKAFERRRVTFTWQYGTGKQGTEEYIYMIKNLAKVN